MTEDRLGGPTDLRQRHPTNRQLQRSEGDPGLLTQDSHGRVPVMAMAGPLHHAEPFESGHIGAEVLATCAVLQGGAD